MTLWEYLKEYLNFSKHFQEIFAQTISDDKVAKHQWILCPKCKVNITVEDVCANNGVCPNCGLKIKTGIDVVLIDTGYNKIALLKEIRNITGLGLAESKDLLESLPKTIVRNAPLAKAEQIKQTLEDCGAEVEIC